MGNSIHYSAMTEMYDELKEDRVFINKNMNPDYPLMANAIYLEDEMQIIMMVWGIPWYKLETGTRAYMRGIPKDSKMKSENYPPVIWNTI